MSASEAKAAGMGAHDSPAPQQRSEIDVAWRQFGAAGSPEDFCRNWLALQCHAIGEVKDSVVVLQKPGTESFGPLAFWPEGQRDRSALVEVTERALREGRGVVQPRAAASGGASVPDRPDYQIAYPIRLDGKLRGVVGLDTGLTHLAAALGTPTVGIYCGSDPALTGLYGAPQAKNVGAAGRPPEVDEVLSLL